MANLPLPDLDRRSVLDVVEENFSKAGLKTYAVRFIYLGEHTLTNDEMVDNFQTTIHAVNKSYCEIPVTGLLLFYDNYFVHILEGSEDTIHRHLRFLFKLEADWLAQRENEDVQSAEVAPQDVDENFTLGGKEEELPKEKIPPKMFRRLKVLVVNTSITTMYFKTWRSLMARPPSLVGKLDVYAPLISHMEQFKICLDKLRRLCALAREDPEWTFEGLSAADPRIETLPEGALLDFLLQSPHLLDLKHIYNMHRRVDDYVFYFEQNWPLSTHFTPRHLYKLKIDDSFVEPLPVMPWEMKKEEDEEEKEEKSDQDSSD